MACTIGAKILRPGDEYVLFKNKDFPRETHTDELLVEPGVLGVLGLHFPEGGLGGDDVLAGFSIGAGENGVCACNSHVKSIDGTMDYDVATEVAARSHSVVDACERIWALVAKDPFNWGNIVVADPQHVAVVEIGNPPGGAKVELVRGQEGGAFAARGNEHLLRAPNTPSERTRRALDLLGEAECVEDVMALCRSHDGSESVQNICRHGTPRKSTTVYSYVMHWLRGALTLWVCQGPPCQGEYVPVALDFPLDEAAVRSVYPGS